MQVAPIAFQFALQHEGAMAPPDKFPSQLAERFQIRLPDGLRDRLKLAADENNRSMNSEIVARLVASLDRQKRLEETVYIGGKPLEINEEIVDTVLSLLETARKDHDAKHVSVPPDQRMRAEGPFRPASDLFFVNSDELDSSELRAVAVELQKEALRLQNVAMLREGSETPTKD